MNKIFLLIVLLFIISKFSGQSMPFKNKKSSKNEIIVYDTVRIIDTIKVSQNRIIHLKNIKSINGEINYNNNSFLGATKLKQSIILNEKNKNIKNMKSLTFTTVITLLFISNSFSQDSSFFSLEKDHYKSISVGAGMSYGAMGIKFQKRYGKIIGWGYQLGIGTSIIADDNKIYDNCLVSFGLKGYIYKWLYLNTQYASHLNKLTDYFAIITGGDWFLNKNYGINLGLGAYWGDVTINPMVDLGISYKF